MESTTCPICRQPNPPTNHMCSSCGADFTDPDVQAMKPGDSATLPSSSLGEAGALAADRFLGIAITDPEGSGLRKLALIGGIVLAATAFVPVTVDFSHWLGPRAALSQGPTLAVLFPLLAGAAGIAMALVGRIDNWVRAAVLAGLGLCGFALCLPPLGELAGAPFSRSFPVLLQIVALLAAGAALALRVCRPRSRDARYGVIAGTVLVVIAMVIPIGEAVRALPIEFSLYINHPFTDTSLVSAYAKGFDHDMMVRVLALWSLLPLLLLPLATALAWPVPGGVWDRTSTVVRPLSWLVALFIPLGFALMVFNVAGWNEFQNVVIRGHWVTFDDFTQSLLVGRARLAVLATFFALWVELGAVVIHDRFRPEM